MGACNELNASYAADGYARLNGMAALIVTNAVGALSAINGVAGAYAEHVPVICVCGSIPYRSMERGLGMHHTMADGTWDRFLGAYAQVTAAVARLTPDNAVTEIDRLIRTAWHDKLPVYMELPSDIGYLDIEVPAAPLALAEPPSDPERLASCAAAIAGRLSQARSPAILADLDADRFGAAGQIMELAEKMRVPVAVTPTAKAVIDETFPYYAGLYNGQGSIPSQVCEASEQRLPAGHRVPADRPDHRRLHRLPARQHHSPARPLGRHRRGQLPGGDPGRGPARRHRRGPAGHQPPRPPARTAAGRGR